MSLDTANPAGDRRRARPPAKYRLRWKGQTSGPHTREHIEELLRCGEISLLHSVEENGEWKGLDEFLSICRRPAGITVGHSAFDAQSGAGASPVSPPSAFPASPRLRLSGGTATDESFSRFDEFSDTTPRDTAETDPHPPSADTLSLRDTGGSPASPVFDSSPRRGVRDQPVSPPTAFPSTSSPRLSSPVRGIHTEADSPAPDAAPDINAFPDADTIGLRINPVMTGYILSGLCFLLPFFATIPALALALWLQHRPPPAPEHSRHILRAILLLTLLGVLFWIVLKFLFWSQ